MLKSVLKILGLLVFSELLLVENQSVFARPAPNQQTETQAMNAPMNSDVKNKQVQQVLSLPNPSLLEKWCTEVKQEIRKLNWNIDPCKDINWQIGGTSVQGRPLVFAEFGDVQSQNTTLVFSTVHGDEITPTYVGIQLAHWLKERESQLVKTRVVIAPLVNPDGFLMSPRKRINAKGVDINRNFATRDWSAKALKAWKGQFKSDPRRFPGNEPRSEPETRFQEELIKRVRPQKILSIHSPLNFLDYDGPSSMTLSRFPKDYTRVCDQLRKRLNAISGRFFPGSLGNYAGQELGIPTLTLELPSADPRKAQKYWDQFSLGIKTMIQFNVPNYASGSVENLSGG